jgi:hypothetical protein
VRMSISTAFLSDDWARCNWGHLSRRSGSGIGGQTYRDHICSNGDTYDDLRFENILCLHGHIL